MIRPTSDENEIKNLQNIKLEDLRSEFVDQVFNLREKIFQSNKIKKIQNHPVSGDMLKNLLVCYVEAINDGAVPNIEQAWNYMC